MKQGPFVTSIVASVVVASLASSGRAAYRDYNSAGFESPRFVAGNLVGQDSTSGPFEGGAVVYTPPGNVTATVESGVGRGGSQGVHISRTGDAQGYYSVVTPGVPSGRYVDISFDMRVLQSAADFGPFFGVQAYGGSGDSSDLIGGVGVDATTGEILFQTGSSGELTPSALVSPVGFGSWNTFDLLLDYSTQTYFAYVNGVIAGATSFDNAAADFHDAPLVATEAAGTTTAFQAIGNAYFDNYSFAAPEPMSLSCAAGIFLLALRRDKR